MSDDVEGTEESEPLEKQDKKKVGIVHLPGGEQPKVGDLFSETMTEFTNNIGPYALAGLGQLVVVMPLTIAMVVGIYVIMFGGLGVMMVGMIGLAVILPEDLAPLGLLIGELGGLAVMMVGIMGAAALFGMALSPISASLVRAVAEHQRGGEELSFNSAFKSALQDIPSVVITSGIVALASVVALMFCYFPILFVIFFFSWAFTLVALHRESPIAALTRSTNHVLAGMNWHLPFFGLYMLTAMVAGYIPVLGGMFTLALHVRAYRYHFGDEATAYEG